MTASLPRGDDGAPSLLEHLQCLSGTGLAAFVRRHQVGIILIPVVLAAGLAGIWLGDPWGPSLPGEAPGAGRGGNAATQGPEEATPLATDGEGAAGHGGADEAALLALVDEPWTGDLDGMIERGFVRVLTVHNPLFFAMDGVAERGLDVEMSRQFEAWLRKRHAGKAASRLHVVMIPPRATSFCPGCWPGAATSPWPI